MKSQSSFLSLNWRDALKGLIVAALTAFVSTLSLTIEDGQLPTKKDLVNCLLAAIAAGVAYLMKNLFTNSEGKMVKKEGEDQRFFSN